MKARGRRCLQIHVRVHSLASALSGFTKAERTGQRTLARCWLPWELFTPLSHPRRAQEYAGVNFVMDPGQIPSCRLERSVCWERSPWGQTPRFAKTSLSSEIQELHT